MAHPATVHPLGFQRHGHYRVAANTGPSLLPAANAILFSGRWGDPRKICIIESLRVCAVVTAAITAQRIDPLSLTVQRSYTANESAGFTSSIVPTGLTGRAHVNMNAPQIAQLAVANASAGISGGTRVADGSAISFVNLAGLGALGSGIPFDDFLKFGVGETFPITLSTNEGITVAWGATALATGSVEVSFIVEWAEAS